MHYWCFKYTQAYGLSYQGEYTNIGILSHTSIFLQKGIIYHFIQRSKMWTQKRTEYVNTFLLAISSCISIPNIACIINFHKNINLFSRICTWILRANILRSYPLILSHLQKISQVRLPCCNLKYFHDFYNDFNPFILCALLKH